MRWNFSYCSNIYLIHYIASKIPSFVQSNHLKILSRNVSLQILCAKFLSIWVSTRGQLLFWTFFFLSVVQLVARIVFSDNFDHHSLMHFLGLPQSTCRSLNSKLTIKHYSIIIDKLVRASNFKMKLNTRRKFFFFQN